MFDIRHIARLNYLFAFFWFAGKNVLKIHLFHYGTYRIKHCFFLRKESYFEQMRIAVVCTQHSADKLAKLFWSKNSNYILKAIRK